MYPWSPDSWGVFLSFSLCVCVSDVCSGRITHVNWQTNGQTVRLVSRLAGKYKDTYRDTDRQTDRQACRQSMFSGWPLSCRCLFFSVHCEQSSQGNHRERSHTHTQIHTSLFYKHTLLSSVSSQRERCQDRLSHFQKWKVTNLAASFFNSST